MHDGTSCAVGEVHFGHTSPSVVTLSGCSPDVETYPDWLLWTGQQRLLSSAGESVDLGQKQTGVESVVSSSDAVLDVAAACVVGTSVVVVGSDVE